MIANLFLHIIVPMFLTIQVYNVLARLPQLSIQVTLRGIWAETKDGKKEDRSIATETAHGVGKDWVPVHADQEYVLKINMDQETFGRKVREQWKVSM